MGFTYYMRFIKTVMDGEQYNAPTLLKGVFHNIYYPALEYIMLESDDEKELQALFARLNPVLIDYISSILPENTFLEYSRTDYSPYYRIVYQNPITFQKTDIIIIDIREKGFEIIKDSEIDERVKEIENLKEEIENLQNLKEEIIRERDYASDDTLLERFGKRISRKTNFKEGMEELKAVDDEIENILQAISQIEIEISALRQEKQELLRLQEMIRLSLVRNLGMHEIIHQ